MSRLRNRQDSEHEQAIIRVIIVALLFALFLTLALHSPDSQSGYAKGALAAGLYVVIACGFVAAIILHPAVSPVRRLLAMVGDFATMSLLMHFGDEAAAPIYPIYLWIAFGFGFRYGLTYLTCAVCCAFIGFCFVILTTPFWKAEWPLGIGLLFALIVLPGYTASLIRKLTEAKAMAEGANIAKSRFLASMSHELRTPLNAVIGMSDLLVDTPLGRDQREMVQTIKASGGALLSLIDDILDLSRIEAGRTPIFVDAFDLHREIADLVSILRLQASHKSLELLAQVSPEVPYLLRGDIRHIRQVLINLAANAIKFTEHGHVIIGVSSVSPARPQAAAVRNLRLRFSVRDTGIGIPADQHARIFERFTQADEAVNRRFGGTGLGLAISKSLIQLMSGRIGVDSVPGSGSTFWIEVPVETDEGTEDAVGLLGSCVWVFSDDSRLIDGIRTSLDPRTGFRSSPGPASGAVDVPAATQGMHPGAFVIVDGCADIDAAVRLTRAVAAEHPSIAGILIAAGDEDPILALQAPFVTAIRAPIEGDRMKRALRAAAVLCDARFRGIVGGEAEETPVHRRTGLRILVAEDNPVNRKVTERILKHAGHVPTIVGSGEEALDALEEESFDLLLVDINMPGISGLEVIKLTRVAQLGETPTPIVALSADATLETRLECEEAGVDTYLTKPIEARKLLQVIDTLVNDRPATDADTQESADRTVTDISSHPRYRGDVVPSIDWTVIEQLSDYADGDDFVLDMLQEFIANTKLLLEEIRGAVDSVDAPRFRAAAHALQGTAGNVGAAAIARACQELHGISTERLQSLGEEHLARLEHEFERFLGEFSAHQAELRRSRTGLP